MVASLGEGEIGLGLLGSVYYEMVFAVGQRMWDGSGHMGEEVGCY